MTGKATNRQDTGGIRKVTRQIDAGPSTRQASVLLVHLDRLAQKQSLVLTCGHTQLPGRGVANVGSFGYLSGNTTSERSEAATAHTADRYAALWKTKPDAQFGHNRLT